MSGLGGVRGAAFLAIAAISAAPAAPTASFDASPGTPSARSPVQFRNRSEGARANWLWTFGDGGTSIETSPAHVYSEPGKYAVTLRATNDGGSSEATSLLSVAAPDTLVLLAGSGHAFEITLTARDPRTGNTGVGEASPQNDVFGYFTVPALVPRPAGAPLVPEVFVKILDARPIDGDFWFFWGGLTDLEYVLTVRDTVRGTVKTYDNPVTGSPACLGADTGGFGDPEGTPTPTATAIPGSPTPTRTATPVIELPTPRTPTGTPRTPATSTPPPSATATRTPTISATENVVLQARPYQWDFLAGPDIVSNPGWPGQNQVTLRVGHTYRFDVFNGSPELDPPLPSHTFSGVSVLGLPGGAFAPGEHLAPKTVTVTSDMVGTYTYSCIDSSCGSSSQHDQMGGRIVISN